LEEQDDPHQEVVAVQSRCCHCRPVVEEGQSVPVPPEEEGIETF
jgi:hypothetical protein